MNKFEAYDAFLKSFGIPAYDESTVREDVKLPYITYSIGYDSLGNTVPSTVSVWYRGTLWNAVTQKVEQIERAITRGGRNLAYDGGSLWVRKGSPWAQRMTDPNDSMIRRYVLNIELEFFD